VALKISDRKSKIGADVPRSVQFLALSNVHLTYNIIRVDINLIGI